MIIPWLKGFLGYSRAPLTWLLILLNCVIFAMTDEGARKAPISSLANAQSLEISGRLYYQFKHKDSESLPLQGTNQWMILGGQALRDPEFIAKASEQEFFGDQVAIDLWKKDLVVYRRDMNKRASTIYGLNTENWNWTSWITYQFMHAGLVHLISNMTLLLIFGGALETIAGGSALLLVYILSGFGGGAGYFYLGGHSLIPMIGASGSLSGVMAFYMAYEIKKRVKFFYFISPMRGFFGWIYLPTLLMLPLCFLPDIVGFISTPAEVGAGVAYTAHIGGAIAGVILGLVCRIYKTELKALLHSIKTTPV